ncbi:MAG: 50S ribosomal protein L11 methyltransferase, partial [Spirochaetes bacterium]|nr:50S ribosomal protein L11 methyltransferase [Spirochaetota bacterium]
HPTTRLCIRLIEEVFLSFPVKSFLDIGSGSGVLAILAAKLGAESVTAIEVDKAAYEKSIENADKNSVSIKVINSGIEEFPADFEYDVVCANLHSKLIEDNIVSIKNHSGENSFLILSGIMNIWADDMEKIFQHHALSVSKKITEGEWVAYLLSCE